MCMRLCEFVGLFENSLDGRLFIFGFHFSSVYSTSRQLSSIFLLLLLCFCLNVVVVVVFYFCVSLFLLLLYRLFISIISNRFILFVFLCAYLKKKLLCGSVVVWFVCVRIHTTTLHCNKQILFLCVAIVCSSSHCFCVYCLAHQFIIRIFHYLAYSNNFFLCIFRIFCCFYFWI